MRTENDIEKCSLCFAGYWKDEQHTCKTYEEKKIIYQFNDLYPVMGMIIRSCYHCGDDVIVSAERNIAIECDFCKNKRELEQAERREKKKKQKSRH
jgi:hypothetical protein